MNFLTSPALSAPLSEWIAWREKLAKMKPSDPSVAFARKRAQVVIERLQCRDEIAPPDCPVSS